MMAEVEKPKKATWPKKRTRRSWTKASLDHAAARVVKKPLTLYCSVLSKWEFFIKMRAAFLLSPSSITRGRMGASKAALILMKNSHFDRTLQYSCVPKLHFEPKLLEKNSGRELWHIMIFRHSHLVIRVYLYMWSPKWHFEPKVLAQNFKVLPKKEDQYWFFDHFLFTGWVQCLLHISSRQKAARYLQQGKSDKI